MIIMRVKARRGRKKKPRLVRGLMSYLLIACVIFGTAFLYVQQRNSITKMGYKISELKTGNDGLDREHHSLELRLSELKQPEEIKRLVRQHRLNLAEVEAYRKVELTKPDPIVIPESKADEKGGEDEPEGGKRIVRR